jgi:hypothetical protein
VRSKRRASSSRPKPEARAHLAQEPTLLDRAVGAARAKQPLKHQGVGFTQLPRDRHNRVVAKPPERAYPLVTVDHDGHLGVAHHDDGQLLTDLRDRREHALLARRASRAQPSWLLPGSARNPWRRRSL